MHTIAILALEGTIAFDLATPIEIFGRAALPDGAPAYRVIVAGPSATVSAGPLSLRIPHRLDQLATADTIITPGRNDPLAPLPPRVLQALRDAHASGTRIASICVGAFTLAAAGLLDGRRATTHWSAAALLADRYPLVDVDPGVLYLDEGDVLTSAGATAGIDLCLHLIERDFGAAVARTASRSAVAPMVREGGQAQYIQGRAHADLDWSLAPTLRWIEENLGRELSLADIAARARLSPRTLGRRFRAEAGMTPLEWITRARVRLAQSLLESTSLPVERIAREAGFGSAANLRARFGAVVGTTPAAYRKAFRAAL